MLETSPTDIAPYALSPGESAKFIGVSRQTIYNMMNDGRLPSVKIGRSRRIRVTDLKTLVGGI